MTHFWLTRLVSFYKPLTKPTGIQRVTSKKVIYAFDRNSNPMVPPNAPKYVTSWTPFLLPVPWTRLARVLLTLHLRGQAVLGEPGRSASSGPGKQGKGPEEVHGFKGREFQVLGEAWGKNMGFESMFQQSSSWHSSHVGNPMMIGKTHFFMPDDCLMCYQLFLIRKPSSPRK